MACKSSLYAVNSAGQHFAANSQVPLGTAVRRTGCRCVLDGQSARVAGCGQYQVDMSVSLTADAAGDVTAQLYQDGVPVPGATATQTATEGGTANLKVVGQVRAPCGGSTLSLFVGEACTLANLATEVREV